MSNTTINFHEGLLKLKFEGLDVFEFQLSKSYHSTDDFYVDIHWSSYSKTDRLQVDIHPKKQHLVLSFCELHWSIGSEIDLRVLTNNFINQTNAIWTAFDTLGKPGFVEAKVLKALGRDELLHPPTRVEFAHGQTAISTAPSTASWLVSIDDKLALTSFGFDESLPILKAVKKLKNFRFSHSALTFDLLFPHLPLGASPDKLLPTDLEQTDDYPSSQQKDNRKKITLPAQLLEQSDLLYTFISSACFAHLNIGEMVLLLNQTADEFTSWFAKKESLSAFAKTCNERAISAGISFYPASFIINRSTAGKPYWHADKKNWLLGCSFDTEEHLRLVQQQLTVLRELGFTKFTLRGLEAIGIQHNHPEKSSGQRFEVMAKILRELRASGAEICVEGLPLSMSRQAADLQYLPLTNSYAWPWYVWRALKKKLAPQELSNGEKALLNRVNGNKYISVHNFAAPVKTQLFSSQAHTESALTVYWKLQTIPNSASEWIAFESELSKVFG